VSQREEFLELDPDAVMDIIGNDSLNVENEEVVFEAIMRWFYFKEKERMPVLAKVSIIVFCFTISFQYRHLFNVADVHSCETSSSQPKFFA